MKTKQGLDEKTKVGVTMSSPDTLLIPHRASVERLRLRHLLMRAEWRLLVLVGLVCAACVVNATARDQAVAWWDFLPAFGASVLLIAIGMYIRATRPMPQLALGAIGFGVFMAFTGSVAIFIYTLFPVANPLIDASLMRADAALGYVWTDFVGLIARHAGVGIGLRYVYLSILPQMVGVIILLAALNRPGVLHRFLTVGIVCMLVTLGFWWICPSVGPGAYAAVSDEIQSRINLVLDAAYGAELRRLTREGLPLITPDRITGVIAFPSFHMVMACMVVWFTWGTWAFRPALVINIAMVPATLSHGGHHLVDVLAGIVTFAMCVWWVNRLVPLQAAD